MAELVDWLHHESITRAATNSGTSYVRQDHHLPHGSLEPSITNGDRIRQMTDEELAKKMSGLESFALTCGGGWPPEKWLEWLRKEVEDG